MEMVTALVLRAQSCLPEGCQGQLAEHFPICNRKAAQLPEAVFRGNLCDLSPARDSFAKFAMDQMQATQEQIALGTYPQDILADVVEGPLTNPDSFADFRQIKCAMTVGLLQFAQPPDNEAASPLTCRIGLHAAAREAGNHGFGQ